MNGLQFVVFLVLVSQCVSSQKCKLLPDLNNLTRVETVSNILRRLDCSDVFEMDDHRFMRRLAYVETMDGAEMQGNGGIWNVLRHQLNVELTLVNNSVLEMVCQNLGVNITTVVRSPGSVDLNIAMVSGVVARFYLHYLVTVRNKRLPPAEDVSGQAAFWLSNYKMNDRAATTSHFTERVAELEGTCGCSNGPDICPSVLPEDWMNHDNANGSCVVDTVQEIINQSGIFDPDHRFMRRIAYVETRDGTESVTYERACNKRVGIWGLSITMLRHMRDRIKQKPTPRLSKAERLICQTFGVNMSGDERLNLRNPLVSGIVARFYLLYLSELKVMPLPGCAQGQADFWRTYYRSVKDNVTRNINFQERVVELEGCRVNSDIMFVLDISSSIDDTELTEVLKFVADFVSNMTIGPDDTRVGAIVFGRDARTVFNFSTYSDKNSLLNAIRVDLKNFSHNIRNSDTQTTYTNRGLKEAVKAFERDHRPDNCTVLKVSIVLSDGGSQNQTSTLIEAKKLQALSLVYAIGVSDSVDETEMIEIAGNASHYTHLKDFDPDGFDRVRTRFIKDICCNATLSFCNRSSGHLDKCETAKYKTPIPRDGLTMQVCTSKGQVCTYVSAMGSPNPDGVASLQFKCLHNTTDCKCKGAYISGSDHSTKQYVRRSAVQKREAATTEITITIEGTEYDNEFNVDITDGDVPTDCVGAMVAEDCEEEDLTHATPEHHKITVPSSSPGPPSSSEGGSSKKTVIIAAVSSGGFLTLLIVSIIILASVGGWTIHRRRKRQKQMKEEEYTLLDNEYSEM